MNKKIILGLIGLVVLGGVVYLLTQETTDEAEIATEKDYTVEVYPVDHASFAMTIGEVVLINDPVGEAASYQEYGVPSIITLTDTHGDHLDVDTLTELMGFDTIILAPAAVAEELPAELADSVVIMGNDDQHQVGDISFTALPMYNLPESADAYHVKGRGNGYLLEVADTRVYIAGDTDDIPEMRALENIDIAFVPMNPPYTMSAEVAADAVIEFAPAVVYPYHYRTPDGLSDIDTFEELVTAANPEIEVRRGEWYQ